MKTNRCHLLGCRGVRQHRWPGVEAWATGERCCGWSKKQAAFFFADLSESELEDGLRQGKDGRMVKKRRVVFALTWIE